MPRSGPWDARGATGGRRGTQTGRWARRGNGKPEGGVPMPSGARPPAGGGGRTGRESGRAVGRRPTARRRRGGCDSRMGRRFRATIPPLCRQTVGRGVQPPLTPPPQHGKAVPAQPRALPPSDAADRRRRGAPPCGDVRAGSARPVGGGEGRDGIHPPPPRMRDRALGGRARGWGAVGGRALGGEGGGASRAACVQRGVGGVENTISDGGRGRRVIPTKSVHLNPMNGHR